MAIQTSTTIRRSLVDIADDLDSVLFQISQASAIIDEAVAPLGLDRAHSAVHDRVAFCTNLIGEAKKRADALRSEMIFTPAP